MRTYCIEVNDRSKEDGGKQNIVVDDLEINLLFDGKVMYIPIRKPTIKELDDKEVVWITRRIQDDQSNLVLILKNPGTVTPENPVDWEQRLGNCPETLVANTLEKKHTKLCTEPVEMEN